MRAEILQQAGLTGAQARVYMALLELGESATGAIIKKTGLHSSVVYNALSQLLEMGLASFVVRGKVKYFRAADPDALLKLLEEKKEALQAALPELRKRQQLAKQPQSAEVFVGWRGVFTAFNRILEVLPPGSEYIGFAAGVEAQYTPEAVEFFKKFQKKRAERRYKVRLIANEEARQQVREIEYYPKFGRPEFRFVPGFAPVGVIIFGDHVLNVDLGPSPVAVIITSRQIAESYRKFFYAMWRVAKA